MTCCMRRAKKVEKRYRRNAIHPLEDIPIRDYVEKINKECIVCYHCKEMFNLRSNEIKINCAGCDKFFHCHIAGKCRGNCTEIFHNSIGETTHTLSYCLNCVNPMTVKKDTCLCNECVLEEKKK
jgi:hypothetical protein